MGTEGLWTDPVVVLGVRRQIRQSDVVDDACTKIASSVVMMLATV